MKIKRKRIAAIAFAVVLIIAIAVAMLADNSGDKKQKTSEDWLKADLHDMILQVYCEWCWFNSLPAENYNDSYDMDYNVYMTDDTYTVHISNSAIDTLSFALIDGELVYCGKAEITADELLVNELPIWHSDSFNHVHQPPQYDDFDPTEWADTFFECGIKDDLTSMYSNGGDNYTEARLVLLSRYDWDYSAFYDDEEMMKNPDTVFETYIIVPDDNYSYVLYDGFMYIGDDGKMHYKEDGKWNATGYMETEYEKMVNLSFAAFQALFSITQ